MTPTPPQPGERAEVRPSCAGEFDETMALANRLRELGTQDGKDGASLIEFFLDDREILLQAINSKLIEVTVRKDADDNLGVIYVHPGLIGHVVRLVYTGRMADEKRDS